MPAVASFIKETADRSGRYEVKIVSLASSASDEASVRLAAPSSWFRGVKSTSGYWNNQEFVHVGAFGAELEFQRYRPRRCLAEALSRCDLIQMVCGFPAWANAVLGLGKPVALHTASRAPVERRLRRSSERGPKGTWRSAMTAITSRFDDVALRSVDAIQTMNPCMQEHAAAVNGGRTVDIRFAPPGVDCSRFRPASERVLEGAPYILCVGRLNDPRKNVTLLLDSFARLSPVLRQKARLVLAGASGPPESFWQKAEELGLAYQVRWVERPSPEELVSLYQRAAVFALPSDEEGFGLVVVEAMACGVPVVSTRSGGPDAIVGDGQDGYLVGLNDATEFADRLARLLTDHNLNRDMGRTARAKAEATYAKEVTGKIFVEVWDGLRARRRVA